MLCWLTGLSLQLCQQPNSRGTGILTGRYRQVGAQPPALWEGAFSRPCIRACHVPDIWLTLLYTLTGPQPIHSSLVRSRRDKQGHGHDFPGQAGATVHSSSSIRHRNETQLCISNTYHSHLGMVKSLLLEKQGSTLNGLSSPPPPEKVID